MLNSANELVMHSLTGKQSGNYNFLNMVFSEQQLVDILRDKCDNAQKRIWIASPYIGALKDIYTIISGKWILPSIDCRILTDINNGFVRQDTFDEFIKNQVEIRTLDSLHAKIYLIDDWCLITSANLTGTAFYYRYEIGTDNIDTIEVENVFSNWWNLAKQVSNIVTKPSKAVVDYQDGHKFKKKYKAQAYTSGKTDRYDALCQKYNQFAQLYSQVTNRNPQMVLDGYTLLQEVDYFFNYLYHDHPQRPSHGQNEARQLTSKQLKSEIRKYYNSMCKHYPANKQEWRLERSKIVSDILSPQNINSLDWGKAKKVISCLHCLSSYPINRTKFLNPKNNQISDIIECWNELLHKGRITTSKIKKVTNTLSNFGHSSIYELIGWYYPDKYPIMNKNSDCGMKFFGFDL